eukprot:347320-Chlamydomonas_euryale.AAC.1
MSNTTVGCSLSTAPLTVDVVLGTEDDDEAVPEHVIRARMNSGRAAVVAVVAAATVAVGAVAAAVLMSREQSLPHCPSPSMAGASLDVDVVLLDSDGTSCDASNVATVNVSPLPTGGVARPTTAAGVGALTNGGPIDVGDPVGVAFETRGHGQGCPTATSADVVDGRTGAFLDYALHLQALLSGVASPEVVERVHRSERVLTVAQVRGLVANPRGGPCRGTRRNV